MKISIQLNNGNEYKIENNVMDLIPVELKVTSLNKNRLLSEHAYVSALDYTFRGVMNLFNSNIKKVEIEKGYWGRIVKDSTDVKWDILIDKTYIVIYTLSKGLIEENMYVADGYKKTEEGKVELNYIDDLLKYENSKSKSVLKDQLTYVVGVFNTYYSDGYKLRYTKKDGLHVVDNKGKKINIDDVDDDFVYTYVVLSQSLLTKGLHYGVFFINAGDFSSGELGMLYTLVKLFFGDTFFFIYNVNIDLPFDREILQLPSIF